MRLGRWPDEAQAWGCPLPQDSRELTHAHLDAWVAEAVALCPTRELDREVAARRALYPGVELITRR
jgi:hypothetical protein